MFAHGAARRGRAGRGVAGHGAAGRGLAGRDKARQVEGSLSGSRAARQSPRTLHGRAGRGVAERIRALRGKTSRGNVFNPAHAAGLPQSRRFADGSSEGEPGALQRTA